MILVFNTRYKKTCRTCERVNSQTTNAYAIENHGS